MGWLPGGTPSAALSLDTNDIISPDHHQQNGYPHAEWALRPV